MSPVRVFMYSKKVQKSMCVPLPTTRMNVSALPASSSEAYVSNVRCTCCISYSTRSASSCICASCCFWRACCSCRCLWASFSRARAFPFRMALTRSWSLFWQFFTWSAAICVISSELTPMFESWSSLSKSEQICLNFSLS